MSVCSDDVDDRVRWSSDTSRDEALRAVKREQRRLVAVEAAIVAEMAASEVYALDGHRSPTAWVKAVSNCSAQTAKRSARTAVMLADLSLLAAAVTEGSVGVDQIEVITRLYRNPKCRVVLPGLEAVLVDDATSLSFDEFVKVCARIEQHADPDGRHRSHEASHRNRRVTMVQVGSGHIIHGEGDAVTGEILTDIWNAHTDAEYQTDIEQRAAVHGDDAELFPLARTQPQRRYDALVNIFLKAADTTAIPARRPLVNIVCTQHAAETAITQVFGVDPTQPYCETVDGTPVDRNTLVASLLIGHIRRIVADPLGRIIDLGRRSRLFTGAAREAVLLSGDRCCFPGCGLRIADIQIDHLAPWTTIGGETNPLNGAPSCGHHNRHKHHNQITVKRDHTGWHHYRPNGTEIAPRDHGGRQ